MPKNGLDKSFVLLSFDCWCLAGMFRELLQVNLFILPFDGQSFAVIEDVWEISSFRCYVNSTSLQIGRV